MIAPIVSAGSHRSHTGRLQVEEPDVQGDGKQHRQEHAELDRVDRGAGGPREAATRHEPIGRGAGQAGDGELVHPQLAGGDLHEPEEGNETTADGRSAR